MPDGPSPYRGRQFKIVSLAKEGKQYTRSKEVDAYIAAQPAGTRRALAELRACIRQAAPEVLELMNYKMPAFPLIAGGKRDQQVMIAGYSKHVGF